jgi:hypothetical protein
MILRQRVRPAFAGSAVIVAIVLVAALSGVAVYLLRNPDNRVRVLNWRLDWMKGADYSIDVANLMAEERLVEAEKLAEYVAAHPQMPGQETIRDLREEIKSLEKKNRSPLKLGMNLITGFLSGGGDSTEGLLGGLLSNILISNGGISESDLPPRVRDDSERLSSSLEEANLGMDGKWFPGLIRTLGMSDLLSEDFKNFLTENAKESADSGEPTGDLLSAVKNTKNMIVTYGAYMVLGLFPKISDSDDIEQLVKWGRSSPVETYIVAAHDGLKLLYLLPNSGASGELLSKIAQKGSPAIASAKFWLKQ